ncbi:MAG TPA: hypothetical protein VJI46_06460 [Candidatus Nanoarchaeia archaeon]|nr:hypothetical protein [Candidatus Nanoarchaeia archaeon]
MILRGENVDNEFMEKCLSKRTVTQEASAHRIEDKRTMHAVAEQHRNNADYFLECAKNLLDSNTSLAAILIAHFAMEHKSNQLIALYGYKIESHVCTQVGLSRIAQRKDLAKKLSDVFALRQGVGYRMSLKLSEESRKESEKVVDGAVSFFEEVDKAISEMKY